MPGVVRTWAPRGIPAVLRPKVTRDHLSVMSGIPLSGGLYTKVKDEALNSGDSVDFLMHLLRCLGRLLVIWDGSPIHRGEVRDFVASDAKQEIHLEALPPYAPDLNPDEGVWQHLKYVQLCNLGCQTLRQLRWHLELAIIRLRSKPDLIQSFFREVGLLIDP